MHIQPDQPRLDPGHFCPRAPVVVRADAGSDSPAAGNTNTQELADLAKQLQSITGIFRPYEEGKDDLAAARTARLAERFESLSLRSGTELNLEMTRILALVQAARDDLPAVPKAVALSEAYQIKEPPAPGFSQVG